MTIKQFIKKKIIATVIFTIIMITLLTVLQIITPIWTNEEALGQMTNDNFEWMQYQGTLKLIQGAEIAIGAISCIYFCSLFINIINFIRRNKDEKDSI